MIYNINKFSNNKFKFDTNYNELLRLPNVNPLKIQNKEEKLITFDIDDIIYENNKYEINYFKKNIYNKKYKYICLTNSQQMLSNITCKSIFYLFPFIKEIDYSNISLEEQYKKLNELYYNYKNLFNYDTKYTSIQNQYNVILKYKQSRKLRFKSLLDNNFFFAIKPGFADVFKLLENRSNRSIFQLDVNSMYPFAMIQSNFSNCKYLEYHKKNDLKDILNDTITNGIFNCILSIKKDLSNNQLEFIKYLPINIINLNTSIPIEIKGNDEVNILLHANEIKYYSKYFDIIIEDGIYSKYSITHPLKNWILDTYQKRLDSSGDLKDFYKFILVLSHSIAMSYHDRVDIINNEVLELFLKEEYQMDIETNNLNNRYFRTYPKDKDNIKLISYDIKNSNNVYSLYSQVLANARIHLLELYEKFYYESSSFELCYCNIDSLHISIPNELQEQFDLILNQISSKTELGKLKIESISNRGIWFEPGRYWLFKDNQLVSYKNTIFNDNNDDYKCTFKKVSYNKNDKHYINYFSLFKSLQHKKRIIKDNNTHYIYEKNNENLSLTNNLMENIEIYKKIFNNYVK